MIVRRERFTLRSRAASIHLGLIDEPQFREAVDMHVQQRDAGGRRNLGVDIQLTVASWGGTNLLKQQGVDIDPMLDELFVTSSLFPDQWNQSFKHAVAASIVGQQVGDLLLVEHESRHAADKVPKAFEIGWRPDARRKFTRLFTRALKPDLLDAIELEIELRGARRPNPIRMQTVLHVAPA